jgi:lipoprotein NlpI
VAQARDREELGQALKETEHYCLKKGDLALGKVAVAARLHHEGDVGEVVKA